MMRTQGEKGDKSTYWLDFVNQAMTAKELERLRSSAQRGQPYGNESWQVRIAKRLGLESTLRTRGRPTEEQNMKIGLIPFLSSNS
jgi:hypothetical protein